MFLKQKYCTLVKNKMAIYHRHNLYYFCFAKKRTLVNFNNYLIYIDKCIVLYLFLSIKTFFVFYFYFPSGINCILFFFCSTAAVKVLKVHLVSWSGCALRWKRVTKKLNCRCFCHLFTSSSVTTIRLLKPHFPLCSDLFHTFIMSLNLFKCQKCKKLRKCFSKETFRSTSSSRSIMKIIK